MLFLSFYPLLEQLKMLLWVQILWNYGGGIPNGLQWSEIILLTFLMFNLHFKGKEAKAVKMS